MQLEKRSDFLDDFGELSRIGGTPAGGVDRQAATHHDGETRRWLSAWLESRGFEVVVDRIGNLFGVAVLDAGAPYVLVGSHLDSQPTAGRLDGAYGVLAAAHAANTVRNAVTEGSITPRANIAVVDWFNEEGSRFAPSLMGSGVYTGKLDPTTCLATTDETGTTVRDALEAIGFLGSEEPPRASAYLEIHVEQGRLLEQGSVDIGLVVSNWAVCKFDVTVEGEQAHTGTADMADRRDALVAAAKVVLAVRELALREDPGALLASVGRIVTYPNVPGVVPSRVVLSLDIRSADESRLGPSLEALRERLSTVAVTDGVKVTVPETTIRPSVRFPQSGLQIGAEAADACGLSHDRVLTRAGHDAVYMNDIVPTIMTFVPSRNGASHSESEDTAADDMVNGVNFLSEVLGRLVTRGVGTLKDR